MKGALFSLVLLFASPLIGQNKTSDSEPQESAESALIRETLTDYIEGSTNGQPDRLRKAFHPDLNLYSIKNGAVSVWPGKDYVKDTKEGKPTGETGKIISIDFENDAAVAKVEISHPNSKQTYIDYFMLLKVEGKWTIIHKMFTKKTSALKDNAKSNTLEKDNENSKNDEEPLRSTGLSKKQRSEIVGSLALALRQNYVFPDVGEKIAAFIEKKQSAGMYENILAPKQFASVLTQDLRSVNNDKHLNLWVVPEKTSAQSNESRLDYALSHGKPANYGFSEVRILEGNIG